MRISGDRKDPDYTNIKGIKVYFNGHEVTVIDADDVTGEITMYVRESKGGLVLGITGIPARITLTGKVEITIDRVEEKSKSKPAQLVFESVELTESTPFWETDEYKILVNKIDVTDENIKELMKFLGMPT